MADPRFFRRAGPFSLGELAALSGAELAPSADPAKVLEDVASLDEGGENSLSFLDNRKYQEAFSQSKAGACVIAAEHADKAPKGMHLLISPEPYKAYALIAQAFYPLPNPPEGIAKGAVVDGSAKLGEGTSLSSGAVIGANVEIGRNCQIGANAVIGEGVVLGDDCIIGANASVSHALLGNKVVIYPGACIGQDGFGFALSKDGFVKVPQLGRVVIHDDVEVGANSTIDRGAGPDTVIGQGCRIDNLVQIGHNVQLGRGCVVVAQVGISGSTRFGDFVQAGGQAGITGHLTIGDGAKLGAQAGVTRSVPAGVTVAGSPARPAREQWRMMAALERMVKENKR